MQEKLRDYKSKVTEKWNEAETGTKVKLVAIIACLIIALGLTIYFTTRPDWVVFESNADIQTIGKIQNAFEEAGIDNQITKNGTAIEVKQEDVNKAKVQIAESNITDTGFTFDDALTANNMGLSESDKDEIYLRAYENDIESQIKTIDGIDSAKVKLVLPNDDVFFESDKQEASAGITLYTSKELSKEQAVAVARLVAMSVDGLKMENIEIVDQNANSLYSGAVTNAGGYSTQEEVEQTKKKEIEQKIRGALSRLYDEINIISNLKMDWDKRQQKTTTYTPPIADMTVGVPNRATSEEEEVVNGTPADAPGVDTNDQNPANYAIGENNNSTYSANKTSNDYLYNKDETVTDYSGGKVVPDQSSIAVYVYRNREYREEDLIKSGQIDDENTWENFKEQNAAEVKMEIDPDVVQSIRIGTGIDNVTVVGYEKPVFIDAVEEPVAIEQIIMLAILAILLILLAFGLIKKTHPDEVEEVEPELSVEDLLVSTQLEDEKEDMIAEIDTSVESEYKKQIEKFVAEKPEAVAQLLRNWLSDEWE